MNQQVKARPAKAVSELYIFCGEGRQEWAVSLSIVGRPIALWESELDSLHAEVEGTLPSVQDLGNELETSFISLSLTEQAYDAEVVNSLRCSIECIVTKVSGLPVSFTPCS